MGIKVNYFVKFGTKKDGVILKVNEAKLTLEFINQIRNYLNAKEKELKKKKDENSKN